MFNNRFNAIFNEQCEEGIEKSENESSDSLFNNALEQLKKVSDMNIRETIGMGATDPKDNSSESAIKKRCQVLVAKKKSKKKKNRRTSVRP